MWNRRQSDLSRPQGEVLKAKKAMRDEHGPRHVTRGVADLMPALVLDAVDTYLHTHRGV